MHSPALSGVLRYVWIYFYLTLFAFLLGGASARPTLASRAIVRPIPMPGFNVSVLDDTTRAPIPQVQASDGGGLVDGRIFSAPNAIWAISAAVIGVPLGVAGVKLWRITTALGMGLALAFALWTAMINTISESGLAASQSMSDMLILLTTGAAFFIGMIGGAFRIVVLPSMAAICALGGSSIAARGVILRPGLLVPPGLNRELAFVNIVIVVIGAVAGGLGVIFKQRASMIFSTSCIGSFLVALAVDLLINGQSGMSRGLRSLFDMNDNHLADLVGGGYDPPLSSQITVAGSLGLAVILSVFQHFAFPGPFRRPRPRDRTQSITGPPSSYRIQLESSSEKGRLSSSQASMGRTPVAPGPVWRTSVLSLFRIPGRSSGSGSSQQMAETGMRLPGKPSNERRGSTAYNYGQGMYALPSELLRRQSQSQGHIVNPSRFDFRKPFSLSIPGRSPQLTGIGLRGYQDQFLATRYPNQSHNPNGTLSGPIRYGGAQPAGPSASNPQSAYTRFDIPRDVASQTMATSRTRGDTNMLGTDNPTALHVPGVSTSKNIPPPVTLIPALNAPADGATAPRVGTEAGMLRMSVDSIIEAYGGVADTGYRYGGSRTGEGGRI